MPANLDDSAKPMPSPPPPPRVRYTAVVDLKKTDIHLSKQIFADAPYLVHPLPGIDEQFPGGARGRSASGRYGQDHEGRQLEH